MTTDHGVYVNAFVCFFEPDEGVDDQWRVVVSRTPFDLHSARKWFKISVPVPSSLLTEEPTIVPEVTE